MILHEILYQILYDFIIFFLLKNKIWMKKVWNFFDVNFVIISEIH